MKNNQPVNAEIDGVVLIAHKHQMWEVASLKNPLFVCTEMFFDLSDIEERRWILWQLISELRKAYLQTKILSEFLLPNDFTTIERNAKLISQQWYSNGINDWSEFRGISIGKCFEYDIQTRIMRRLKFVVSIRRLIECFPVKPLYCDYADNSEEKAILLAYGIYTNDFDKPVSATKIEKKYVKSATNVSVTILRKLINDVLNRLEFFKNNNNKQKLPIIIAFPTPNILKALDVWKSEYNNKVRVVLPSIAFKNLFSMIKLIRAGAYLAYSEVDNIEIKGNEIESIRNKLINHIGFEAINEPYLNYDLRVDSILINILNKVIYTELHKNLRTIKSIADTLDKFKPNVVVLPNDNQTLYRAWALVAKKFGVITVTPQHGHPMFLGDGNHMTSDFSIFWSKLSSLTYIQLGLDPSRALISGFPSADVYQSATKIERINSNEEISILIITTGNPGVQVKINETWVCEYIMNILVQLLNSKQKLKLKIKLHPGESRELYYNNIFDSLGYRANIYDNADLIDLIKKADIIVSPPSTCVLQALCMNKPVILVSPEVSENVQLDFSKLKNVVTAIKYDDILKCLNLIVESELPHNISGIEVSEYIGIVDGNSSKRLMETVYKMASNTL